MSLSQDQIDALKNTIENSKGLPGEFFYDQGIFDLEMRDVFSASWVCAAVSDDVKNKGDTFPVTIAGKPIVIVRSQKDELKAYHNICSHRGAILVSKPQKKAIRMVCPYHAWAYNLNGELKKTPHVGGQGIHICKEITPEELSLKEVSVASWAGLLFVNVSGAAESFDDFIAPMKERLKIYDLSELRFAVDVHTEFKTNWKLVVENFVESYHLPWIHQNMNVFNPMRDHYQILGGNSYLGQGLKNQGPTDGYAGILPPFPNLTPEQMKIGESHYLLPNVMFGALTDYFYAIIFEPVAPGLTRERVVILVNGEEAATAPEHQKVREGILARMVAVNNEDIGITESAYIGRQSPAYSGGQFSYIQEQTSLQMQQMVAIRLLQGQGLDMSDAIANLPYDEIHHPDVPTRSK